MKKTSFYALVVVCTSILPVSLSAQVNVAPSGLASASAATWQGQPAGNIIDGSATTQSHPLGAAGETLGFKYTVNLYASYPFETLELVNRTGCCPERLSNYRVSLHEDDEGAPGPAVWSADIRTDGSNSGDAGVDSLTADLDPTGTFVGQYIIVENLSNAAYNPQIAELRALSFQAPPANLATGKPVALYDDLGQLASTWGAFGPELIVDGAIGTISHPLNQSSPGYYYEIDLQSDLAIGDVSITGRVHDGCCPERLEDARLQILDSELNTGFDQVILGQTTTPVTVPVNVSNGRYVRIINANGAEYGPQISEVVVTEPSGPLNRFQIVELFTDTVTGDGTLTFNSTTGKTYLVFGSSDLKTWGEVVDNVMATSSSTEVDFNDPDLVNALERYYIVREDP